MNFKLINDYVVKNQIEHLDYSDVYNIRTVVKHSEEVINDFNALISYLVNNKIKDKDAFNNCDIDDICLYVINSYNYNNNSILNDTVIDEKNIDEIIEYIEYYF